MSGPTRSVELVDIGNSKASLADRQHGGGVMANGQLGLLLELESEETAIEHLKALRRGTSASAGNGKRKVTFKAAAHGNERHFY